MFKLICDGVPEPFAYEDKEYAIVKANVVSTARGEDVAVVDMGTGEIIYETA